MIWTIIVYYLYHKCNSNMINKILDPNRDNPDKHWEDIIILLSLLSVAAIHYFIYSKMAFLDFFYLLVVMAGYYVGKRLAILGPFSWSGCSS